MNKDIWGKLTSAEQDEINAELNKILQEELNREIITEIKRQTAGNKLGNRFK